MDGDDHPSALAWLWVIEALSTSNEIITPPTLQGLIDSAPVGQDSINEITRELVALGCLEKLASRVVDPEASSTLDSRVGFDFSRGCEDVLEEIFGKIPLSNLKTVGAELLKLDVYPFIKHKRAGTFKCHLEQLREMILGGTLPHSDCLKERSGLFPQNSCYTVLVEKDNSVSLNSKEPLDDSNFSCSKSKRSRVYSADDHKIVRVNECDDFFRNSKRIKCYASTGIESKKEKPVSMNETNDTAHHAIPTNDANAEKNQHMIHLHYPKRTEPDIRSLNLSQKPVASDKIVIDMINDCGADLSSDSNGYHSAKSFLEAKKYEFICSQHTADQELTRSTKQNLCMKCNEGGQLLACKTASCLMTVHKNCLGASAQLDAKGNFLCPFCAYSHATSEYLEAYKKAFLTRKELAIFISKGKLNQAAELVYEFHRQERCSSCREKENVNNGSVEALREEEIGEMPNEKSLTGGRVEGNEVSTDHVDGHVGDKFPSEKTNIAPVNKSNAGEEDPQEITKQHNIDGTVEPVCAHDTGKEEISKAESEKHSISNSVGFCQHETQCKPQASYAGDQSRRKRIRWTVEEEDMLREGVRKFGDSSTQWKDILAFGSHVFEKFGKHRTPQDLKDKWRNICKANKKSK